MSLDSTSQQSDEGYSSRSGPWRFKTGPSCGTVTVIAHRPRRYSIRNGRTALSAPAVVVSLMIVSSPFASAGRLAGRQVPRDVGNEDPSMSIGPKTPAGLVEKA